MRHFWDAAVDVDPGAAALDEGVRFPPCRQDALVVAFRDVGLRRVESAAIDSDTTFADFENCWTPFLGGQGPAPAYAMSRSEDARARLRGHLRHRLPRRVDGSIGLRSRPWGVRGSPAG